MIPVHAIPAKPQPRETAGWKRELAEAISNPVELLRAVGLDDRADLLRQAERAQALFRLRVPRDFVARMRQGDPDDPLLLQVLPLGEEFATAEGFLSDPVGDLKAQRQPGLLHKYHGRALLITTGVCAINCRYCFRREYPYTEASASQAQWQQSLDYIGSDSSISEIILSGGDPLTLSDKRLGRLLDELEAIPNLRRLRIHSRLPVVLPSRVTEQLVARLASSRFEVVMVIHSNHAQELSDSVAVAIQRLRERQIHCLNQAVLLKNVNDSAAAQIELSEQLFTIGVLPYYLHLLDRVKGAAHFEVEEQLARQMMQQLRSTLPGYLVPRLVREIAGEPGKTPISD